MEAACEVDEASSTAISVPVSTAQHLEGVVVAGVLGAGRRKGPSCAGYEATI